MAKPTFAVESDTAAPQGDYALTLGEFCTRLSSTDRRVELIGAFEHVERVAGRETDKPENYAARYNLFINLPA